MYYYVIVLLVMILLNTLFIPKALSPKVKQVGYDTFLDMIDAKQIKEVQVEDNQIIFLIRRRLPIIIRPVFSTIQVWWIGFMRPGRYLGLRLWRGRHL